MSENGLTTLPSIHSAKETMDRLEADVKAKSLTVFARVDHAAGAKDVGMQLRPTELLIFGNAKGGTPLMQALQTTGIDLPLKALVWEDAEGKTWISYTDPVWIARRHGLPAGALETAGKMREGLDALINKAVGHELAG